jgi:predicted murein hydrolase (TIGR00659 family)
MASEFFYQPLFGVSLSVAAYVGGLTISQKIPRLHPLFFSAGSIILLLLAAHIPYDAYKVGGDWLTFFLGPATIGLGVPLYKFRYRIQKHLIAIMTGITVGSLTGIISAGMLIWLLGGTREITLSMMTKSVSAPISIEITKLIGGAPVLSAVLTVLTGLIGSMFGKVLLQRLGIKGEVPLGIALGTAAHGIGTAKLMRSSESEGSYSAFAMAMSGIITGIWFIPIIWWMHR